MDPILWTAAGYARQETRRNKLQHDCRKIAAQLATALGGRSAIGEDRQAELVPLTEARDMAKRKLEEAESLFACLRKAQRPTQTDHVQLGSEVAVKYLDDCSRKKRGEHESFIIGGLGEVDEDSILRTFSCGAAFGRSLINKEIGDKVTVQPDYGKPYRLEIIDIRIPAEIETTAKQSA